MEKTAIETTIKLEAQANCPIIYQLQLSGENKTRKIAKHFHKDEECKGFSNPLTFAKTPKLYVIRDMEKNVLYVGYADQKIGNRMRYGLNPKHQKGYHGYGWMMLEKVELMVWVFQSFNGNKDYDDLLKRSIECIEAEIVFYVRDTKGKWPENQKEIHFGNENRDEVKNCVSEIIKHL